MWKGIGYDKIDNLLCNFEANINPCFYNNSDAVRRYIKEQVHNNELTDWCVAVVSRSSHHRNGKIIKGNLYPFVERRREKGVDIAHYKMRAITGSHEEAIDLSDEEYMAVLSQQPKDVKVLNRELVRSVRPPERGLLLIYLVYDKDQDSSESYVPAIALSFPASNTAKPLAYTVNEIYKAQFGLCEDQEEYEIT